MQEAGAFEAENTFGSLLDRVELGEEIVITRHGKPVARLVASSGGIDGAKAQAAAERLGSTRFSWKALKAERGEGRP